MINVAAYCRVSTEKEDQQNSFQSQKRYFEEYIDRNPEWELYEVFADEGLSGTSTKKRIAFNRMINDALLGKFDLIITKEVSRFSRNILDTIKFTRELKQKGIGVLFLNDGINTLDSDSELRLSIMGSIAQEESRKTSERVKWGQQRCMERGVVFGRSLLGYDVKGGKLYINPDGAETVRLIFKKFLDERKGTHVIARELREAGIKSFRGDISWSNTSILKIIRNEKYCGDLIQRKTITKDYLTHEKKYNRGEVELIIINNHHEPIISHEEWELAQQELQRRSPSNEVKALHGNRYALSGKIKCAECGSSFVSRFKKRKDGSRYKAWRCLEATRAGLPHIDKAGNQVGCDIHYQIRDEMFMLIIQNTLSVLSIDKLKIIHNVTNIVRSIVEDNDQIDDAEKLKEKLCNLGEKKQGLIDIYLAHDINKAEFREMSSKYDEEIKILKKEIALVKKRQELTYDCDNLIEDISKEVNNLVTGEMQDEIFYGHILKRIEVHKDHKVEVYLNLLPFKWAYILENLREKNAKNNVIKDNIKEDKNDNLVGTEELAHLEMVGTLFDHLLDGATKDELIKAGFDGYYIEHGCNPFYVNTASQTYDTVAMASKGDAKVDMYENMAAEQKARITYENLIKMTDDPLLKDSLRYLRAREVVHFQRFGETLRLIEEYYGNKKVF